MATEGEVNITPPFTEGRLFSEKSSTKEDVDERGKKPINNVLQNEPHSQCGPPCDLREVPEFLYHPCPKCPKKFSEARLLNRHLRIKNPCDQRLRGVPLRCARCDRGFTNKAKLKKHLKRKFPCAPRVEPLIDKLNTAKTGTDREDSMLPENTCDRCGRFFSTKYLLHEHQNRFDTGGSLVFYPCEKCSKVFSSLCFLRKHQRAKTPCVVNTETHPEKFKISCVKCRKVFATRPSLYRHQRSQRGCISPSADFKGVPCDKCFKTFSSRNAVKKHQRSQRGCLSPSPDFKGVPCDK
jgi:hypothetical protein